MSRLRDIAYRALKAAGARWLTPVLVGSGLTALLFALVLQASDAAQLTPDIEISIGGPEVTRLLATNPFVLAFFVVLLVHLCARWALGVIADRQPPSLSAAVTDRILAEAWRYAVIPDAENWQIRAAEHMPQQSRSATAPGRAVYRKRPSRVPLRVWQFGLLLMLGGLIASALLRQSGTGTIGEGQVLKSSDGLEMSRYEWRYPASAVRPLTFEALRLEEGGVDAGLDAAGQPRGGAIIRWPISARFAYLQHGAEKSFVAGAYPPALVGTRLVQVTGVGLGPHVVAAYHGQPVVDSFAQADLLPGQSSDASLTMEPMPYALQFTLLPNAKSVTQSAYALRLVDSRGAVVASGTVGAGRGSVEYAGWSVQVPETRYWVAINVTRDPGLFVIAAGLIAFVAGMVAWWVVLALGWERYSFVEERTERGLRLYAGADASPSARRRATERFSALVSELSEKPEAR